MKFDKETPIVEKQTYTMQNFHVSKNAEKFKASHHEFMLKFNGGTRVSDVNKHEIPETLKFKEFSEIIAGNIREDYLYGIYLFSFYYLMLFVTYLVTLLYLTH
jgi:hypothetical protein